MKPLAYCLAAALLLSPCAAAAQAQSITTITMADQQAEDGEAYDLYQTAREANLRSRPGKKAARINTLPKGKKVKLLETVEESGEIWAHIRVVANGQEGYVLMSLLEKLPDPPPPPAPCRFRP